MEKQAPSPDPKQESEEFKPVESYPPEHISSIIERSQLGPAVGSLLAQETIGRGMNPEQKAEIKPEKLDYELGHEAKDRPIADSQPEASDMDDQESYLAPRDKITLSRVHKSFSVPGSKATPEPVIPVVQPPVLPSSRAPSLYKTAILSGLIAALSLIILFALSQLIS